MALIRSIVVSILVIALIAVFYFGEKHSKQVNADQANNAKNAILENEKLQQKELQMKEEEINKWKPNGSPRSYNDDVKYYKALKNNVVISTLGSSVTAGAGASDNSHNWSSLLTSYLQKNEGFTSVTLNNNGFGGYTTEMIISDKKVDTVISQKPDIVLFETCLINDHGKKIPLDKTEQNIASIVKAIHSALPDAKIILMSPNPRLEDFKMNNGLLLADYVNKTNEYFKKNGWDYIDIYNGFKDRNADMKVLLSADGTHPNDEGYKMWFEIVKNEFEKKH